jgi:uroporphyrinogen III methyltransferase/synthase
MGIVTSKSRLTVDMALQCIATGVGTLVFLMGVKNLPNIVENLVANGRPADTPVALIRWGTTPRQETLTGTLATIVDLVKTHGFKAPAITVVGEVVGLRDQLRWFEERPLFGRRVVVTRSRSQASDLVAALAEAGALPVEFPTIKVTPPSDDYAALDEAIVRLRAADILHYDWLIFTSVNGVEQFFGRLDRVGDVRDLKGVRLAAIGPATAAALKKRGLAIDFVPGEYRAEAVIEGLLALDIAGTRVLIPRARGAREILPEKLAEAGVEVDVVPAYETVLDETGSSEMKDMLASGDIDVITFTSSSTVKNFVSLLDGADFTALSANVTIACIGPITADTARGLGLRVDLVAGEYTIPGLVSALIDDAVIGSGQ